MQETHDDSTFHIDMHVHSAKHSECAESLNPYHIEEYARKAGVQGIVLAEHDTLWSQDQFEKLQKEMPSIVLFNGIEVTTQNGFHLVLLGIEDSGPLYKGIPCMEAINYAHNNAGIAILAHPFRNGLPPLQAIKQVDAIEIGSTSLTWQESQLSQHLAKTLSKPVIGCSDAHALSRIGWAYTQLPERPSTPHHLCKLIRDGACRPVLPNPFFS